MQTPSCCACCESAASSGSSLPSRTCRKSSLPARRRCGFGLGVQGFGFRVQSFGFGIWGLRLENPRRLLVCGVVSGLRFRVSCWCLVLSSGVGCSVPLPSPPGSLMAQGV